MLLLNDGAYFGGARHGPLEIQIQEHPECGADID